MRLFTAILFQEDRKNELYQTIEKLKHYSKGSFTVRDNLHLTVNFIGETDRLRDVKQAMLQAVDKVKPSEFLLSIRGIGKFKREEGDIYWAGIEKEDILLRLQKELVYELRKAGFPGIEDKEFTPHLTLGRKVIVGHGFNLKEFEDEIVPMQMKVDRISLMKSERIQGKLVYTEIFSVRLNQIS